MELNRLSCEALRAQVLMQVWYLFARSLLSALHRSYPVKAQVRNSNTERLKTLSSPLRTFTAIENSTVFPWHMLKPGEARTQTYNKAMEHLDKHVMVPHELYLKKGAQVMLVKNMSNGLVNGSRGVVVGFRAIQSKQDVSDDMGVLLVVGADTAAGQPDSYKPEKPSAALEVVRPAAAGETSSRKDDAPVTTGVAWPVVKFSCGDMLVPPVEFEVEDHTGHVEARRTQVRRDRASSRVYCC